MKTRLLFTSVITSLLTICATIDAQKVDMSLFNNIEPRNIGPAGMSGRVTAIDVVLSNTDIIYAGAAAGGIWKSENAGNTWTPIFENELTSSIGDIAIYQKNPQIIYVGTGEGNPRNSQNSGRGMYKTIDGGSTWEYLGLEMTRQIHRVIVHPDNPDVVWAGALGSSWAPNQERGVYKSEDGGKTWHQILYVDDLTGVADLRIDPSNPNKLIAALWEHLREPWFFNSGGSGSGIYITSDGGDNWEKIACESGLPCGDLGRIGIAFAPSKPEWIYAYVESKENAVYRSEDGGNTWMRRSKSDENIGDRPFYYADLYVDVKNENRLYSIATAVTSSEDGGKTWEVFAAGNRIHTDHHAWWANPDNSNHLINGNDGGLFFTSDRGKNWLFADNLPLAQFYHLRVDNEIPYNVYGGLQDNGSWCGPSQTWFKGGIRNMYWQRLSTGDGFDVVPDPLDNQYGYAMGQAGSLVRYHKSSGQLQHIKPVHPDGEFLRWNWNAGIAINPLDNKTIYYGSQFVHRSSDHGRTWDIISPDLTTNDPEKQKFLESGGLTFDVTGAEFHCSIISIVPNPLDANVIWVGTDDGNVQITTNGGDSWTLVSGMSGVPDATWAPHIHASSYNVGEAWVVFDDHRRNNWEPYVFHTTNHGESWSRVVDMDDVDGFVYTFTQDPEIEDLWFCGTDVGLYFSIDAGEIWNRWTQGYPTTPTSDLVIHPRDGDLVIGTFGRAFWILDDIRPLRELTQNDALLDEELHAFISPDAILAAIGESHGYRHGKVGDVLYNGENRPYGSLISYYIAEIEGDKDTVELTITSADGKIVRHLKDVVDKPGIHRTNWDLSRDRPRSPSTKKPETMTYEGGAKVPPGSYAISINCRNFTDATEVVVLADPRLNRSASEFAAKNAMITEHYQLVSTMTQAGDEIRDLEKRLHWINDIAKQEGSTLDEELMKEFSDNLKMHKEQLLGKKVQGIYRQPTTIVSVLRSSRSMDVLDPVSKNQERQVAAIKSKCSEFLTGWEDFKQLWIPRLRQHLVDNGVSLF